MIQVFFIFKSKEFRKGRLKTTSDGLFLFYKSNAALIKRLV